MDARRHVSKPLEGVRRHVSGRSAAGRDMSEDPSMDNLPVAEGLSVDDLHELFKASTCKTNKSRAYVELST